MEFLITVVAVFLFAINMFESLIVFPFIFLFLGLAMVCSDLSWRMGQKDVRCDYTKPYVICVRIASRMLCEFLFCDMQVIVSGKLRAQRAKSMKFKDGYMISSGQPVKEYIDSAVRHVLLRQVCLFYHVFKWKAVRGIAMCLRFCYLCQLIFLLPFTFAGCSWYQSQDHARLGPQG